MRQKDKTLIKNIGLFTLGSFGSKILSFFLVPLYTVALSTEEYGYIDLVTSTVSLLTPILLLSIFDATLRFGMDSTYKKEDVLSTSINITVKGSLILVVGVIFVAVTKIVNISNLYLIFLVINFILGAFSQIFNLYLKAANKAAIIAISGISCTLVICVCNLLFLLVLKWGVIGYMISSIAGMLIQNVIQYFFGKIYRDIRFRNYNDLSEVMIKYSLPLIANSISWWINNASDRYILTFFKGVAENGIYSVAYKIPTILTMIQGIFYNAWSISAIKEFDKDDSDGFIGLNYTLYSFISLVICSGLSIINIPVANFLYKGDYFVAWKCVPFLLMSTVFSGISQFEGSLFAATKNTKMVARTTIIGAIVNITFNLILINNVGTVGAALATLLGYFVTWILRTKYLLSFINMKVRWVPQILSIVIVFLQITMATIGGSFFVQILFFVLLLFLNSRSIMALLCTR